MLTVMSAPRGNLNYHSLPLPALMAPLYSTWIFPGSPWHYVDYLGCFFHSYRLSWQDRGLKCFSSNNHDSVERRCSRSFWSNLASLPISYSSASVWTLMISLIYLYCSRKDVETVIWDCSHRGMYNWVTRLIQTQILYYMANLVQLGGYGLRQILYNHDHKFMGCDA